MLSSIRRALTPNTSQVEDGDYSGLTLDSSPAVPRHLHTPSPPPFSPIEEDPHPPTTQASHNNNTVMPTQKHDNSSPDQGSPAWGPPLVTHPWESRSLSGRDAHLANYPSTKSHGDPGEAHEETNGSIPGPVTAIRTVSTSRLGTASLDDASDDSQQPPSEGAVLTGGSPLPSIEPLQSTSNHHQTRRTPTPYENHTNDSTRNSSPRKFATIGHENDQPIASLLPPTEASQSTSKYHPIQQNLTQNEKHAPLAPYMSSTLQASAHVTGTSRGQVPQDPKAKPVSKMVEAPYGNLPQSAPVATDAADTSSSSKAEPPRRKREDDIHDTETKPAKKRRGKPKKEGDSTTMVEPEGGNKDTSSKGRRSKKEESSKENVEQQVAVKDKPSMRGGMSKKEENPAGKAEQHGVAPKEESSKKGGRLKKVEVPTGNAQQQDAVNDKTPKKRGRPKKREGSTHSVEAQHVSEDTPAKQGRPKKDAVVQTARAGHTVKESQAATDKPKKRGRPAKEAEVTHAVEPASMLTADTPKKKGRPKKEEVAVQDTEMQIAPTEDTPKKKGRAKKVEEVTQYTDTQGSFNEEPTKKRGRPKKNELITEPTETQGSSNEEPTKKRGRPKKNEVITEPTETHGSSDEEPIKKRGRPKATEHSEAQGETLKGPTTGKRGRPKKEHATPKGAKPTGIVKKKKGKK